MKNNQLRAPVKETTYCRDMKFFFHSVARVRKARCKMEGIGDTKGTINDGEEVQDSYYIFQKENQNKQTQTACLQNYKTLSQISLSVGINQSMRYNMKVKIKWKSTTM